ncbi:MAG: hypothetical protein AAF667_01455 [Pseudomonadota bacterium]
MMRYMAVSLALGLTASEALAQNQPICRNCTRPVIIYEPDLPVVPVPAGLPLALTGIGALVILRRMRKR